MANQIIFPEHNQFPRNAFSCGQAKQGVGLFHSNYRNRVDKSALMLNYGQIPLTKSRYYTYVTNDEHTYGENSIVAIMCYSGFNVEDAIIINRGFLERGGFSTTKYEIYETFEENTLIGNTNIDTKFINIEDNNVVGLKPGYDYSKLDKLTGIIKPNTIIDEKTVLIGKVIKDDTNTYVDMSVFPKKGTVGIVEKSFITEGQEGRRIAKVKIRSHRMPEIGDKFCSRAGQKGTVGIILTETDMPTTAEGLIPDIIVNPHAMPSRMTIGHMVEAITSKLAAIFGGFGDCTAFNNKGSQHEIYGEYLTKAGFEKNGHEILYNGMTGEQLETDIYIGPTYYLRLKHMPKDKINYRGRGPRTVLTRQTVGGRANDGGLRIGEMDRDCLIAHGMNAFIKDSMLIRGDEFYLAVCNQSGYIAAYNEKQNLFLCPFADGPIKFAQNVEQGLNVVNINRFGRDFSIIRIPYAFKLLMQELQVMNVQMRIITEDNVNQLMSLVKGYDLKDITGIKSYKEYGTKLEQIVKEEERKFHSTSGFKPLIDDEEEDPFDIPQNSFANTNDNVFGVSAYKYISNEGEWGEQNKVKSSFGFGETFGETIDKEMTNFENTENNENIENIENNKKFEKGDIIKYYDNDNKTLLEYVIKTIEYDPDGNTYVIERNENGNRRVEIVDEDELISIGKENELTIKIPTKIQTEIQTGFLKQPISPAYDPNNPPVYEPTSPISPA